MSKIVYKRERDYTLGRGETACIELSLGLSPPPPPFRVLSRIYRLGESRVAEGHELPRVV